MSFLGQTLPWPTRLTPPRGGSGTRLQAKLPEVWRAVSATWQRLVSAREARSSSKRLRVVDKVLLGDKQFVALLELDGKTFLASGGQGVPVSLTPSEALHTGATKPRAQKGARKAAAPSAPQAKSPKKKAVQKAAPGVPSARTARTRKQAASDGKEKTSRAATARKSARVNSAAPKSAGKVAGRKAEPRAGRDEERLESGARGSVRKPGGAIAPAPAVQVPALPALERERPAPVRAPLAVVGRERGKSAREAVGLRPPAVQEDVRVPISRSVVGQAATQVFPQAPPAEAPGIAENARRSPEPARLLGGGVEESAERSASTAFAALLELRMLASEVFEEIEAHSEGMEGFVPEKPASVREPELREPERAAEREPQLSEGERKGPVAGVSDRFRRRLSAFACFLVLVLVPHETARAGVLPVARATPALVASWVAWPGPVRASPALVSGAAIDGLALAAPRGDEIRISGLGGSSASWSIVVVLTLLTLIPSLLFCITPFARLLIVFHFLRQALGLQTTPSNQTLIGLSLILTFFLMQPTGAVIYRDAIVPAQAGTITPLDAVERAGEPMRHFMAHYVREKDAELFLEIAKEPRPRSVEELSFRVLLPAYILSELKAGFQIGTVLFLPFLIVDMVVASITTSVGMMQLPPVVISTPLKLLLFLMVDGWHLLIGALMRSFN